MHWEPLEKDKLVGSVWAKAKSSLCLQEDESNELIQKFARKENNTRNKENKKNKTASDNDNECDTAGSLKANQAKILDFSRFSYKSCYFISSSIIILHLLV